MNMDKPKEQPESVWRTLYTVSGAAPVVVESDLPEGFAGMYGELYRVWSGKLVRNRLKYRYYDGKNKLKDLGISTPPQLLNVETVVGWPQKAVDALAVRSRFDGYIAGDDGLQARLDAISEHSRIPLKYRQAVQGELIHSCCFAVIRRDATDQARIDIYDAESATAVWDDAAGRIAYGMIVNESDGFDIVDADVLTDEYVVHLHFDKASHSASWSVEEHTLGRTPMAAFCYRPTLRKPFGVSRISRSVMSLTDSAVRVALGGDISYQFAVSPQKYLLNADKNPFDTQTRWEAYIGSIFAVSNDSDNGTPVYGQLTQASMQQTVDYMRLLANRFAAETNIPLSQLGVASDANPQSAEAMYAASEPLIIEAEELNDTARLALKDAALMALAVNDDIAFEDLPPEYRDFSVSMRNPAMPSVVSQADAMVKIASVVPAFAGTDMFFEQMGFSEDMRRRVQSDMAKASGTAVLNALMAGSVGDADTA